MVESEYENIAEQSPSRGERALQFLKRHGLEIALGIGFCAISVFAIREGRVIKAQGRMLADKNRLIDDGAKTIDGLKELCAEKDAYVLKLASDALRKGSSEGGRALVDYRDFKNGRL